MEKELRTLEDQSFPSLTFRAGAYRCAISARHVSGIMLVPDTLTPMPYAPPYCAGLVEVRGMVVPMIDLRALFGLRTLEEEHRSFCELMDTYKHDHETWVTALRRSIDENTSFELATDAHECRLGKWFYNFKPTNHSVSVVLDKLRAPHEKFHETAIKIKELRENPDGEDHTAEIREMFATAQENYKPQILGILEEAKTTFLHEYQSVLVTMENNGDTALSFIVDGVDSVEIIKPVQQAQRDVFWRNSQFVTCVGKSDRCGENILMLDDEAFLQLAQTIDSLA